MAEGSNTQVITLSGNAGTVIVQRGGIRVEFNTGGGADVYTDGPPVMVHPATNDHAKSPNSGPHNDSCQDVPSAARAKARSSQESGAACGTGSRDGSWAQKVLEVGDRLRDGTVCIAVDLKKNKALFAPAGIIGGKAKFDDQHEIPDKLNKENYLGYGDWRNITDDEGKTLSEVWDKVAPDALKGRAAPWFWLDSSYFGFGKVRRSGEEYRANYDRYDSLPVPVARSGPAVV